VARGSGWRGSAATLGRTPCPDMRATRCGHAPIALPQPGAAAI